MTTLPANRIHDSPTAASRSTTQVLCAHCGLPVPLGMRDESDQQFCCVGCRAVYAAIRSAGLDTYYELREQLSAGRGAPATSSGSRFESFDDPRFVDRYATGNENSRTIEFYVEGLHCPACVWLIEQMPGICIGLQRSCVHLSNQCVSVQWDPEKTSLGQIARQLDAFGYTPHPFRQRALHEHRRLEDRRSIVRIAVAGAIAGNVMLISFALYGGMLHGMHPMFRDLFHATCAMLTGISLVWPGRVFFAGAWRAVRAGRMHMDVPVAVGLAAGSLWSVGAAIAGAESVYFDSMTVLIFLLLIGRWVQQRQQRRSQDALELLFTVTPATARVRRGDSWREADAETLQHGDLVRVLAGETVPADGIIVEGTSTADVSLLTGETTPVACTTGDDLAAGATNLLSPLVLRITAAGDDTRVAQLMKLVEDAARRRAPVVALADRIAGWFVITVLILACLTAGIWMFIEASSAVEHAVALLIITCPCALGLATPLALMAGIGQAAKEHMLIKGGDVIEQLVRPGMIFFDKTGTLTHGNVQVIESFGDPQVLAYASAIEQYSTHPIARAIVESHDGEVNLSVTDIVSHIGFGVEARIDHTLVHIGSVQFIMQHAAAGDAEVSRAIAAVAESGRTLVLCAVDGIVRGGFVIGDALRAESAQVLADIRSRGWRIGMISGDSQRVVDDLAATLGLDPAMCHGDVTPECKLQMIEAARNDGTVAMVGDGVNDAAALAAADVGIAVRGSAEASMAAADVFLAGGIHQLPRLMDGSKRCFRTIRTNLIASLGYNVVGVSLAVAGLINPIIAAVLMPLSSLTVMTLSYRSRSFTEDKSP